jgi:hypothetical protein
MHPTCELHVPFKSPYDMTLWHNYAGSRQKSSTTTQMQLRNIEQNSLTYRKSFSSSALQSNADLRLLNGLLPVISNRSDCSEVSKLLTFPGVGSLAPRPTPNLEDQVSILFISPGDWVAQLYPEAPSTHFSRLLRHAWATVGLFLSPVSGHHTGIIESIRDSNWMADRRIVQATELLFCNVMGQIQHNLLCKARTGKGVLLTLWILYTLKNLHTQNSLYSDTCQSQD